MISLQQRQAALRRALVPGHNLCPDCRIEFLDVAEVLVSSGLAKSKTEARQLIQQKAIHLNQQLVIDPVIVICLGCDGIHKSW